MMRTGAGSSRLPAPALAKATQWEEGAMTNRNIAHSAMRGFPFGPPHTKQPQQPTEDEARRIASNIVKLPSLLGKEE